MTSFAIYTTNRDATADTFELERFAPLPAGGRWWLTVPIVDDDDETESVDTLVELLRARSRTTLYWTKARTTTATPHGVA